MSITKQLDEANQNGKSVRLTFLNGNDCIGKIESIVEKHIHFKTQTGTKTDFWIGAIEKVELLDKDKTK